MALWNDTDFRDLTTDARLLFIWSWTNPEASISGLYHVSVKAMGRALGRPSGHTLDQDVEERVEKALEELGQKPLVLYDYDEEVIWVVNRARFTNRSPNQQKAIQRGYESCPPSPLREQFKNVYESILEGSNVAG